VNGGSSSTATHSVIHHDLPGEDDRRRLAGFRESTAHDAAAREPDELSRVIVQKPWGHEYELTRTESAAAWILFIKPGSSTSLHCHRRKATSLTVLAGTVQCQLLDVTHVRESGESVTLGPGVFHRTTATSLAGAFVLEVESPIDKFDLVRISDDYGRENQGYESSTHWSARLWNANYHTFAGSAGYFNSTKRFPDTTVSLVRWQDWGSLREQVSEGDTLVLLDRAADRRAKPAPAENPLLLSGRDILGGAEPPGPGQGLLIRRADSRARYAECIVEELLRLDAHDFYFAPSTTNTHLIDAIAQAPTARWVVVQTDLAAVQAAEAHAKLTGRACVAVVGTGAAATGMVTGLAGAYVDSAPVIVVSCRSRLSSWHRDDGAPRQLANKDVDIVGIGRPITKQSWTVESLEQGIGAIRDAWAVAMEHRRGPALVDFPIDFLGARVDRKAIGLDQPTTRVLAGLAAPSSTRINDVVSLLREAERPVLLVGHGVRAAGANDYLRRFVERARLPVLLTRRAVDLLESDHPLCFGRPGTYGQRCANFILQNSDLLLAVGARLSLPLTGRNREAFARAARRVVVDVDPQELAKSAVRIDMPICCDAGAFLEKMTAAIPPNGMHWASWLDRCSAWRRDFPPEGGLPKESRGGVDPYWFIGRLASVSAGTEAIVCDGGPVTDFIVQSFAFRRDQRFVTSAGLEAKGFALAGAIGASVADRDRPVFCLMETSGLQASLAELHTLAAAGIPVKLFVFNGLGDIATRGVQKRYFGQRFVGFERELSGRAFDVQAVAAAFSIPSERWGDQADVDGRLGAFLEQPGPGLAEVVLPIGHEARPHMGLTVTEDGRWTSRPLEDMEPLLHRDVLEANMMIPLWPERT
jgi:acetolactate synthase-1/2/3 large subunit